MDNEERYICSTPEESFELGQKIGTELSGGEVLLLYGGLGAGKTLLTKGIMSGLGYDIDEVTSPSFTLVNHYPTEKIDVYHIDLWRLDAGPDPAAAVGLDEIIENEQAVTIIEWADRLAEDTIPKGATRIYIKGDGDQPRTITISKGHR